MQLVIDIEQIRIIFKHFPSVDSFKWFVLGDWGGWPAPHYSSPIQKSVADSMGRTSRIHRPEYIVGLGDNFYYHGVENENDPMFENTFENIYTAPNLQCPWYHTTGNHDWSTRVNENGDIIGGNVTAQIAYSDKSDRWMLPDLFYKIDTFLPNGISQRIIMIDTPSLSGVYATRPIDMTEDGFPANKTLSEEKLGWLEDVLASSDDFDYIFVAGHYQILDVRGYYDPLLKARVLPLLQKYNVNAYLQGHYHTLEHAQEKHHMDKNLHFFTIGAGALLNSSSSIAHVLGIDQVRNSCFQENKTNDSVHCHFFWAPIETTGGYGHFTTTNDGITVELVESQNDRVLYKSILKPRK